MATMDALELEFGDLGTLELDGLWVPYFDRYDDGFLPTRVKLGDEEFAFNSSQIIFGHSATMPQKIRELRAAGKKPLVIQRKDRYYIFA